MAVLKKKKGEINMGWLFKLLMKQACDAIRALVLASETEWDDKIVLPLLDDLEAALDL